MDAQDAIDLGREALWLLLTVSSPVLLAGLAIALVIGLLQAMTQIQEQTVAFVPKIVLTTLVLVFSLPFLVRQMVQYTADLIGGIAQRL